MRVQDLARLAGVPAHVVRYYARIRLLRPERDPHNTYRRFGPRDVERLLFIRVARRLGCSLADIAAILGKLEQGPLSSAELTGLLWQRLAEIDRELASLQRQRACLDQALVRLGSQPDEPRDLPSLRHLMESMVVDRSTAQA
jgi:DNA-binding transcriptional MerR regulator